MKKTLLLLVLPLMLAVSSCKDDFEVAAPYQQITVAYAIFNKADKSHYVRIQKAFLDNNKSSIDMAKEPDSSFYKDLTVVMKEFNNETGNLVKTIPMTRVDLNIEGYPKDEAGSQGFFTKPSYAYKLMFPNVTDSLNPFLKYRLVIKNNATGRVDSSDFFAIVNSNRDNNPSSFYISTFTNLNYALNFAKTEFQAKYTLSGKIPRNAKMIEGIIRFHMVEKDLNTGTKKNLSADLTFGTFVSTGTSEQFKLEIPNSSFYGFLYDAFGAAPVGVQRYIDSCDFFIYAGSHELYNYYSLALIQNSSLLGDQIKPIYSNMRGENTYGILASRALNTYLKVPIDEVTIDSIKLNKITKPLNIIGRSDE